MGNDVISMKSSYFFEHLQQTTYEVQTVATIQDEPDSFT
jgi:hypothetical protein